MKITQKTSIDLSVVVLILSTIAAAGGIFLENLYQDNEFINRIWLGNDIVTLVIAVPVLLVSLILSSKGSEKAGFIWLGSLWYMIYNYLFYSFGASFNSFFLLHIFIFILSAYAFILGLASLDLQKIEKEIRIIRRIPFKRISVYLLFFGLFIGGMWIVISVGFIFSGIVPEGIVQTGHSAAIVFAIDLAFLVSPLLVGGYLLWHRNIWGYIISCFMMIKCILYPFVLALGGLLAYTETGIYDPLTPAYLLLGAGCFICLLYLLFSRKNNVETA